MRANIARPAAGSEVFVMPMDTGESAPNKLNVAAAVCSALTFGYRLTLQKHKLIGIP